MIKIEAATRLIEADRTDDWFESLTDHQKEQYLDLHPASKFAKNAIEDTDESKLEKEPVVPEPTPAPDPTADPKSAVKPKINKPQVPPKAKARKGKALAKGDKVKTNTRYPITKFFVNLLKKLFTKPETKYTYSGAWIEKHPNAKKDRKISPHGYWTDKNTWHSETKKEWDASFDDRG